MHAVNSSGLQAMRPEQTIRTTKHFDTHSTHPDLCCTANDRTSLWIIEIIHAGNWHALTEALEMISPHSTAISNINRNRWWNLFRTEFIKSNHVNCITLCALCGCLHFIRRRLRKCSWPLAVPFTFDEFQSKPVIGNVCGIFECGRHRSKMRGLLTIRILCVCVRALGGQLLICLLPQWIQFRIFDIRYMQYAFTHQQ